MKARVLPVSLALLLAAATVGRAAEVRTLTLENGLEVVMMPDASSPLLSALTIVRVGSAFETLATAGSTHLLEHMLFRGTPTRTQDEIYDSFDLMGAYFNAQTEKIYTNFILVVPVEHARQAMEIQADMILRSTIPAESFEEEKGRVIAEIQQSYNRSSYPAEVAHLHHLFGGTPYGFPTLGSVNGIRAIGRETVARFHEDWYAVNNMVLVLRGAMSYSEMEALAREIYGDEPARRLPERPESWPVGFEDWREGMLHVEWGDVRSGTVHVSLPAPRYDDGDYPAFSLLASLLDDRIDAALSTGGMPLTTYAYSSLMNDPSFSVLDITAGLMPGSDPREVVDRILGAVRGLGENPPGGEELKRALEADRRQELFFSEQVQYGAFLLVPKLALAPEGFWERFESWRDSVDEFSAAEVAERWLARPVYLASAYLPKSEEAATGGVTLGDLAADTLENGLVVLVRPVHGAPVAGLHLVARDRALLEGPARRGWVDLLHRLLLRGYGPVDEDSLSAEMDAIGMELTVADNPNIPMDDYRTTPEYSYVRCQVLADRWTAALDLLARLLAEPRMEEDDIAAVTGELQGIIRRKAGSVRTAAGAAFARRLYGASPLGLGVYGDGSTIGEADRDALLALRE
ncbi:MAG TPA: insulinase family protein, partial [Bacteroidetes bacterium]|nr:insulinase family protein [Bacteroidota bacterium]